MKIRSLVVAAALCLSLSVAGCAGTVAGQAQIVSGATLPTTSRSAPSPFPDPSTATTRGTEPTIATDSTAVPDTTAVTESTDSTDSTGVDPDDTSVGPTSVTSVPGLSKDCNTVLAGITAFSKVLQGAGSGTTITQQAVDETLALLPQSGLPARPQADFAVLRATVSGAAGKTVSELAQTLIDGKVVDALQDLSGWAQANCG